jgi:DNA-binding CsgD family transcriptional regulator
MQDFTRAVLRAAECIPVAILVDDVHLADAESLRYLLFLVHRLFATRIVAVLSDYSAANPDYPRFRAEVERLPHTHRLTVAPLSPAATTDLVAAELGLPRADPLVAAFPSITGGNQLLVRRLLTETRRWINLHEPWEPSEPSAGKDFGRFLLGHLDSTEPQARPVAEGLAVLDEQATPKAVADLVGLDSVTVGHLLDALGSAGMTEGSRLRHPLLVRSVLDGMPVAHRAHLHRRAAEQLLRGDAPALRIARHLLASDRLDGPWVVPLLKEAAKQALMDDQSEAALSCLNAALQASTDNTEIAELRALRIRAERRNDPAAHFRLPAVDTSVPAASSDILGWLHPAAASDEQVLQTLEHLGLVQASGTIRSTAERLRNASTTAAAATAQERLATRALITVLVHGPDDQTIREVEHILHSSQLDEFTVDSILLALLTLLYADQLSTARFWCDLFMKQTGARNASAWHASFAAVRTEIALRQGELETVRGFADAALGPMAAQASLPSVGLPLGALVRLATELGRHDQAAALLSRPVPQSMFGTRFGLHYRTARGHHYLATGKLHAALEEFRSCGTSMREWGLDQPSLVPWRSEQALVLLRLGDRHQARELAAEQLESSPPGSRSCALSMYAMALASEGSERISRLRAAVRLFDECGDKLHLARAGDDLAAAARFAADPDPEEDEPITNFLRTVTATSSEPRPDPVPLADLSPAERRVAMLAAAGCSNPEISRRLYITISTVEQHLTRIYRKLTISRRAELKPFAEALLLFGRAAGDDPDLGDGGRLVG